MFFSTTALLQTVHAALLQQCHIAEGAHIAVALSGGADSVALALLLKDLGCKTEALHCNFHLRGEESMRDEAFVREFCARHAIPLHVTSFDTTKHAATTHQSIEMAARELRYAWFEAMRKQLGAEAIAVAHHRDDNAETLLLNLIRGTGVNGLCGMAWRNGHIIRPLLDTPQAELLKYLEMRGEAWVTDSTNSDTIYRRNKIRHEVLPLLREINPSIDATLADTARRMHDTRILVQFATAELLPKAMANTFSDGFDIDITALFSLPAPQTLLYELLTPYGFSSALCEEISQSLATAEVGITFAAADYMAVVGRGVLEIIKTTKELEETVLHDGKNLLSDGSCVELTRLSREDMDAIPREKCTACLDADKIAGPLLVRSIAQGDRFVPFGMHGSKLVSDYLTDRKASARRRHAAKVVCDGETIVWLVDERPSDLYAITESTKNVLMITIQP